MPEQPYEPERAMAGTGTGGAMDLAASEGASLEKAAADGQPGPAGPFGPGAPAGRGGLAGEAADGQSGPAGAFGPGASAGRGGLAGEAADGQSGPAGAFGPGASAGRGGLAGEAADGQPGPAGPFGPGASAGQGGPARQDEPVGQGGSAGRGGSGSVDRPRSLWSDAWRDLRRNPVFLLSGLVILFLVFVSLWPSAIASGSPLSCDLAKAQEGSGPGAPFGYDGQGCNVYTRTVYGARTSVTVGVLATLGVAVLGSVLGGLAGFFGGAWDSVLSRATDVFFAIPVVLGGLVLLSVVTGDTVWPVIGFMVLLGWPQISRIARGSVITAAQHDYVQAARALGASHARVLLRHIAPNAVAPVIVVATIALGTYIALEATLSYLGVGLKPPTVSWGIDISAASPYIRNAPHALLWPSGALAVTVLAFIMLGDAVRDALDPKLR